VAKPIVDGIEKDLQDRAQVVRVDVWSDVGKLAAQRYGVRSIPTLVVFDGAGQVQDIRAGVPDRKHVVELVNELALLAQSE
jgi:thioredoxin-like negative regulator of GroEL